MDLCFDVSNQTVTRTDKNKTVNWSDEYLRLVFDFKSDDWSDCSKFILVFDNGEVYRFALSNNAFIVPEELLTDVKLVFSIYGVNNSYRITTPKVMLRLLEAGYTSDVAELDVEEFTHDVVEEVYIAINSKANATDVYTKTEVDNLIYGLNNKMKLDGNAKIIQTDDTLTLTAYVIENGFPVQGKIVTFYIDEEE